MKNVYDETMKFYGFGTDKSMATPPGVKSGGPISTCSTSCAPDRLCGAATKPKTLTIPSFLSLDGATVSQINIQRLITDSMINLSTLAGPTRGYDSTSNTGYRTATGSAQVFTIPVAGQVGAYREVAGLYLKTQTAQNVDQSSGSFDISFTGTGWNGSNPPLAISSTIVFSSGCEREYLFMFGNFTTVGDAHLTEGILEPGSALTLDLQITVNLPTSAVFIAYAFDRYSQEQFGLLDKFQLR